MTTHFEIKQANWNDDCEALRAIRTAVFIEEQLVPKELEWDDNDESSTHWLAIDHNKKPVGVVRMLTNGHIGRMAVLKQARKKGIGKALLEQAINYARHKNLYEVFLHAQTHALTFYQKAGFITYGSEFIDAGITHRSMRLQLSDQRLLAVHGGDFSINDMSSAAQSILSQATQQLRILSFDLNSNIFNTQEMTELLSKLARKSRYSRIHILVADTSAIIKKGHRWLELQRRLTEKINIRRISCEPHLLKNNLIIADRAGFICQSIKDPEKIWGNFNNIPTTTNHIKEFDDLWDRAINDKDLRQLSL
jgi:predicted GNAT family N-acyltransferase